MKILFYDAKQYDIESFNKQLKDYPEITVDYIETDINERTASLADGYDAVCAFVSSDLGKNTIKTLGEKGVSLILTARAVRKDQGIGIHQGICLCQKSRTVQRY